MSETSFLNVYKLLSDAPDPYPLLDAAVDQTVKVAEARMLESELGRLREENGDLKKQLAESSTLEDRLKKADKRADDMEQRVSYNPPLADVEADVSLDGRPDTRSRELQGERAECTIR